MVKISILYPNEKHARFDLTYYLTRHMPMSIEHMSVSKGFQGVSVPGVLTGLPVIRLTTIGAKSGKLRTLPVVGLSDGDKVVVIASNYGQAHHPAWYFNLRAHPEATLEVPGRTGTYLAREATPAERQIYWRRASDIYVGFPAYQQRTQGRVIPIIVLTPQTE
jgi:deazaflavin-dependent oxidoreductase (nitroreductase family)